MTDENVISIFTSQIIPNNVFCKFCENIDEMSNFMAVHTVHAAMLEKVWVI